LKDFYQLASTRRSIRKYLDKDVSIDEVIRCINTAVTAPSGCNSQCWYFVVISNKEKINKIAKCTENKIRSTFEHKGLENESDYIEGKVKGITLFKNAPICVAIYMTYMSYYDKKMEALYEKCGYSHDDLIRILGNPDLLSIGAVIQTFLLALHEKNIGTCWMNEPLIARDEIESEIGINDKGRLISLIPIGYSKYKPENKEYKKESEIMCIIS